MMIYLDNAATTRVRSEVLEAMLPYLTEEYGNPSGVYSIARSAHSALDRARERMAKALNADYPREIFFTGCGTESDNWALTSATKEGDRIITSMTEHHAILETCAYLEKHGREVTYLKPDEYGRLSPEALEEAIGENTALVSIMHANNEVGTINPIKQLAETAHRHGALFHTDAVQSVGHIKVDVKELGVDLLSLSAHKFHAPKGVGALYVRNGIKLEPFMRGGAQERSRRAGTENLASIVGMGLALELADKEIDELNERLRKMSGELIDGIMKISPEARLNGHPSERLPGNVNISFKDIKAETMLFGLDLKGIAASAGSACTAGALAVSHVIKAMGVSREYERGAVRFTLSRYTSAEEIEQTVKAVGEVLGGIYA